jgi:type IV secretory pathway protease TraF
MLRSMTRRRAGFVGSWQPVLDELIGVVDHIAELVVVDRAVQLDGVPVALVLVVAGTNRGIHRPQLERRDRDRI